jgi:hypothetical protein
MDEVRDKLVEAAIYVEGNPKMVTSMTSFPYIMNSRVKDDLAVMPKALEKIQGSALALAFLLCELQNFGEISLSVEGTSNRSSKAVNSENEIGECMRTATLPAGRPSPHTVRAVQWECSGANCRRRR